jgi:hypothetical protein
VVSVALRGDVSGIAHGCDLLQQREFQIMAAGEAAMGVVDKLEV